MSQIVGSLLEKIGDGYVPADHREIRFSFKPFREVTSAPELESFAKQLSLPDNQLFQLIKGLENRDCRVYKDLELKLDETSKTYSFDFLLVSSNGITILKILNWQGKCVTNPGEKWVQTTKEGAQIEHENQLVELDDVGSLLCAFLSSKGLPKLPISSFVIFADSSVNLTFSDNPNILVGISACDQFFKTFDITKPLGYLQWGQSLASSVYSKIRGSTEAQESKSENKELEELQKCLDIYCRDDVLQLRDHDYFLIGRLKGFKYDNDQRTARMLERICARSSQRTKKFLFEHPKSGFIGAPVAFVTGNLGWEPLTRVVVEGTASMVASLDVPPITNVLFQLKDCEHVLELEVNDIRALELGCLLVS